MVSKKGASKEILYILVLTTITVIVWIGLDVYRALTKKVTPKILKKYLQSLDPKIDLQIVERLKTRKSPTEEDFQTIPVERKLDFKSEEKEASPAATPEFTVSPTVEEE